MYFSALVNKSEYTTMDHKIKTITLYRIDENPGKENEEPVRFRHSIFDKNANVVLEESYDQEGNFTERYEREYDEDNELVSKRKSVYNENGNLVEFTEWSADTNATSREIYTNDKAGRQIESKRYNGKGELLEKLSFKLDEEGYRNRIVQQLPDDESTIVIERDEKGNVIKQEEFNSNQHLNSRIERKMDDKGNVVESHVYVSSPEPGVSNRYTIRYDYEYFA